MPLREKVKDPQFLNVDLDIYSRKDLQPLVNSFGKKVIALYVGRERGRYSAHLELIGQRLTADSTLDAFCALIRALPKPGRALWNSAKTREFSVGVEAGQRPFACDFRIEAQTVKALADLGATIVLTVYGPERSKRRSASKADN